MKQINANKIKKYDHFTVMIYSEPGKGKTTMVKSLKGKTVVFSVDGMYSVLAGLDDVEIIVMDSKNPTGELGNFYRYLVKNKKEIDNIVFDNLSTFQVYWLNAMAHKTKSGMPEIKDYAVFDRVILEFIASLKMLEKNLILFAHEKSEERTRESGGVYTQFLPSIRAMNVIMGIVSLVGRLVIVKDPETQQIERTIVLQPTQSTRAKDQLIGDRKTIGQMELFKILQN